MFKAFLATFVAEETVEEFLNFNSSSNIVGAVVLLLINKDGRFTNSLVEIEDFKRELLKYSLFVFDIVKFAEDIDKDANGD